MPEKDKESKTNDEILLALWPPVCVMPVASRAPAACWTVRGFAPHTVTARDKREPTAPRIPTWPPTVVLTVQFGGNTVRFTEYSYGRRRV